MSPSPPSVPLIRLTSSPSKSLLDAQQQQKWLFFLFFFVHNDASRLSAKQLVTLPRGPLPFIGFRSTNQSATIDNEASDSHNHHHHRCLHHLSRPTQVVRVPRSVEGTGPLLRHRLHHLLPPSRATRHPDGGLLGGDDGRVGRR